MCNHQYVGDHSRARRSMGQRCPYPELYDALPGKAPVLPIDASGACIFHSKDVAWKRTNDFRGRFMELLELLGADDARQNYDFVEFVFVGGDGDGTIDSKPSVFRLADTVFPKASDFTAASFLDSVEFERVTFKHGAAIDQATFARDLRIRDSVIGGLDFSRSIVAGASLFAGVELLSYALFNNAQFLGAATGTVVRFESCLFQGITDFSGADFVLGEESTAGFRETRFEDFTNFQKTRFHCHVEFDGVSFGYVTEFVDTQFDSIGSSARYRGAAVEFNKIEVPSGAVLTFKSTDPRNKMFQHDVQMSFGTEPAGTIRFDNVDFSMLSAESRLRLMRLSKTGTVQIGAGCIKYRYQTPVRSLAVVDGNSSLVIELCQTFTSYFAQSNGLNLGFEIVDRSPETICFFYFTDEDVTEEVFFERLAQTERRLWNLLSVRADRQLPVLEEAAGARSVSKENTILNAVDGISALLGTFFRVGARIAMGIWKESDTRHLLSAIRFNEVGADERAASLHRVIEEKYTGKALFAINQRQNDLLLPMLAEGNTPREKVRILFLAANSSSEPLDLARDVARIQRNLKLAQERDNLVFIQEWAVTIEGLTQAMLDESPTIVHFAGHGLESGLLLESDAGEETVLRASALARLFELFQSTVRCVVLSACDSVDVAHAIRRHIPYVIAINGRIPDSAAIAFSTGFYQGIGAGREIPFAFKLGIATIELEGLPGEDLPILI